MKRAVYDSGVLIAADRDLRRVWAEHRIRLEANIVPLVPATVVAQTSRSPRQASLRRFLRGCEVAALTEADAHRTGALLAETRTKDVVDASVVELAVRHRADIVTADRADIARLLAVAGARLSVVDV